MRVLKLAKGLIAGCFVGSLLVAAGAVAAEAAVEKFENSTCLGCHGNKGFDMPVADGHMRSLHVNKDKFGKLL